MLIWHPNFESSHMNIGEARPLYEIIYLNIFVHYIASI